MVGVPPCRRLELYAVRSSLFQVDLSLVKVTLTAHHGAFVFCRRLIGALLFFRRDWRRSRLEGDGWEVGAGGLMSGVRSLKAGKIILPRHST